MNTHSDFASRHIGPQGEKRREMLKSLGYETLEELIADIVPADIRMKAPLDLPAAKSEPEALEELRSILGKNKLLKSFIGQGYYGAITPSVILRNILENPGWYTAYTPYQPEIAQGRLEMLMNFQTMVASLTGLPVANASLLDEGTAAAEAVSMCRNTRPKANTFFVADTCHPQTISVIRTRAAWQGVNIVIGDWTAFDPASVGADLAGVLVQYPDTLGRISDYTDFFSRVHAAGALCVVAADLMALTVIREPGSFGADICVGNTQRFGVPMGFGGPHAAYMSCTDALKRRMPGRLIGMSIDPQGRPAYRLALQTREQHIRRDKATSNICTAQVLLAVMAAFYAVYHGQEGLKRIGTEIHRKTKSLYKALTKAGISIENKDFFDTLLLTVPGRADALVKQALDAGYNIRKVDADHVAISLDETASCTDVATLASALTGTETSAPCCCESPAWAPIHTRQTPFCTETAFNSYHSETEMMRYIRRLESRDLALNEAMIPLGSCTMKLNAASEMIRRKPAPCIPSSLQTNRKASGKCSPPWRTVWRKSRALPPFPSSPTRARQGNMRGFWLSAATSSMREKATGTSASSPPPPTARTPLPPPWPVSRWSPSNATKRATSTWTTSKPRQKPTGTASPASWSPTPPRTASMNKPSESSATSSMPTAARCTWTEPT